MRLFVAVVLGAAAYYGATRIGYAIAFVHGSVSAVWPPTGVALAMVWIGGPRMLPAVFLGELTGDLTNGSPLVVSLAFAAGSTCEALTGYGLLKLTRFRAQLDRVRDVFALLLVAAFLSTMTSATIGTATLLIHGDIGTSGLWSTWHVWWLGDLTGDIVVAPLLLLAAVTRPQLLRGWRLVETVAFAVTLGALAVVAHSLTLGIAYLVLPVLIWAALRLGQRGAVLANAVLAGAGVIGAAGAASELARVSVLERILFTQNFVTVGAITTLVLAALMSERDRAASSLQCTQGRASALAAERTALGQIATAIARGQSFEQVLVLVARHATTLLGGASAELTETVGGTSRTVATWVDHGAIPGPSRASASIAPEQREWGTLDVIGLSAAPLTGDREQLLHRLADLAGLAISGARARRRLEIEAMTDALTGLHNQRAFRRRLSDEISRAERYGRPLSLVLIDLDAFKAINDVDGHLTGDMVLAEVARRILAAVRIEGLVARLGGDEMAILLPECDAAGAYSVAERVREAVSAAPIGTRDRVTISTGIAERRPDGREEDMISHADAALYCAKRMGGDQGAVFSPQIAADRALSPETLSSAPLPAGEARSA